jgi:hypothetical protein
MQRKMMKTNLILAKVLLGDLMQDASWDLMV